MTAEVASITTADAERLATRIGLRLESMADSWSGALPLIREAIDREAFRALGYRSHGDFIADRFGNALSKLGMDLRREVTRELSDAGLSVRAIASVTGVSKSAVQRDISAVPLGTPVEASGAERADETGRGGTPHVDQATGEVLDSADGSDLESHPSNAPRVEEHTVTEKTKITTGIDGKQYKRPEPVAPKRKPLIDEVRKAREEIYSGLSRLQAVVEDDRFTNNKADIQESLAPVIRLAREVFPDFE